MSDKHTPGPWAWDHHVLVPERVDCAESNVQTIMVAETFGCGFVGSDWRATMAESDANMELVAAAPDLLKALREVVRRLVARAPVELDGVALEVALAAIAKATGEVAP